MLDAIITRMTFPWTTSVAVSILFPAQTPDDLNGVPRVGSRAHARPRSTTGDTLRILTQSDPYSSALTLEVYSSTAQNSIFCCAFSADRGEEEDIILALMDVHYRPPDLQSRPCKHPPVPALSLGYHPLAPPTVAENIPKPQPPEQPPWSLHGPLQLRPGDTTCPTYNRHSFCPSRQFWI
ncbi:hypothetical protein C8F01DRAFT_139258 [Mycena amicta]|nr:hypothetical protein C8F01DRAFT_139258 [Mycena amicta]